MCDFFYISQLWFINNLVKFQLRVIHRWTAYHLNHHTSHIWGSKDSRKHGLQPKTVYSRFVQPVLVDGDLQSYLAIRAHKL